jgi:hypothetical protein
LPWAQLTRRRGVRRSPSPESPTRSPVLARVFERRGNFWEGEREREGGEIFLGQVYKPGTTMLTQPALPRWTATCARLWSKPPQCVFKGVNYPVLIVRGTK